MVYFAYGLASEPIRYAMLLGITVFLPIAIIDFLHFVHKHNSLQQIKENLDVTLLEMPPALNTLERDYQEIANTLYNEKANIISTENIKAKETKEYYTMWVHQIKTPIAAMQLLLANTPQNAQISAELFQVEQYADMALNYARLENIHNDLEIKEYPLDEIIGKALKKYSRLFILKKTNLNFSGTGVTVLTDEKWLEFVLEQLL
ncbi:MAG: sensor histidine kinase, partial [Oscillospiraceae bacterium]